MYVSMVGFLITTGLVLGIYSQVPVAQATPGMMPFGGFILYNEPSPLPNVANVFGVPVPPCPPHIVMTDYSLGFPKVIGITFAGLSVAPTFEFYNLYTPGVADLGEYIPVPLPNCVGAVGVYYPVFPVFFNAPYGLFQMGTGDIPGF